MTGPMAETSVIIVTFNGLRWLGSCLTALTPQVDSNSEIILVDNASSDGSVGFVRRAFPRVRIVTLETNRGFAVGSNEGYKASSGRLLVFLNNDTKPAADWLQALRRALEEHVWADLATSLIVFQDDPSRVDSAGDGFIRSGGAFKRAHGQSIQEALEPREVFGVCGAACLIRREVFEDVGGFDEDFFMVHEDVDLSYRAQLLGYRCVYAPHAIVVHAGSGTLGRLSPAAVVLGQRNLEWVYLKNTPWLMLVLTLPGHLLYNIVALVHFAVHGLLRSFAAGKWRALKGLPGVWRKRREIQDRRRTSVRRIWRLMEPRWFVLKLREKRVDLRRVPDP